MLNEQKYKRWAWGALIGLGAIIIIAGLIMTMSAKSPKPNTNVAANTASKEVVSEEKNEKPTETKTDGSTQTNNQTTETKPSTTESNKENATSQNQSNSGSVVDNQAVTVPETNTIPKTGPEEAIIPILGLAVCAYLFAYNAALFKKNA
ncbi:MAG: hypothetical protein MJ154_00045 [Candidatus Saccharibacteria bacterium]|nr:hypothetical protein [Candidatus Saccharibacteria bacterium]